MKKKNKSHPVINDFLTLYHKMSFADRVAFLEEAASNLSKKINLTEDQERQMNKIETLLLQIRSNRRFIKKKESL